MSENEAPDTIESRRAPRHSKPATDHRRLVRRQILLASLLPFMILALASIVTATLLALQKPSGINGLIVLILIAVCGILLAAAWIAADTAIGQAQRAIDTATNARDAASNHLHQTHRQMIALRSAITAATKDLRELARQTHPNVEFASPAPAAHARTDGDAIAQIGDAIAVFQQTAQEAFRQLATRAGSVQVLVHLAQRMQSLAYRALAEIDRVERDVDDPRLLKELFAIDHFLTLIRRAAESLGIYGGSPSRRRWSAPQTLSHVLRAAAAEIEKYSRVKVPAKIPGVVDGSATADVTHLFAELLENATNFSPDKTDVQIRAAAHNGGLIVEIIDWGLGIRHEHLRQWNALLADPEGADVTPTDGRIGLAVVAVLARRYGITVHLTSECQGWTRVTVILPSRLAGVLDRPVTSAHQPHAGAPASPLGPAGHRTRTAIQPPARSVRDHPPHPAPAHAPNGEAGGAPGVGGDQGPPLPHRPTGVAPDRPATSAGPESLPPSPASPPFIGHSAGPPPLPMRQPRAHLAPPLRTSGPGTARNDQPLPPTPNLLDRFRAGFGESGSRQATGTPESSESSDPTPDPKESS